MDEDASPAGEHQVDSDPEVGPITPVEDKAPPDVRRFRVVAVVAGLLLLGQVIAQVAYSLFAIPTVAKMFSDMGGELPAPTAALVRLGPWLAVLLLVVDALIFWGFYRLARKYWVGLLFAPLFVVGFVTGLVVLAMYLPLFQVVALVRP